MGTIDSGFILNLQTSIEVKTAAPGVPSLKYSPLFHFHCARKVTMPHKNLFLCSHVCDQHTSISPSHYMQFHYKEEQDICSGVFKKFNQIAAEVLL